jgi:hypothetical protein
MDMFAQSKLNKWYRKAIKELKSDIKHYLNLKNTDNLNRTVLADVLRRKRTELLNVMTDAQNDFNTVNWI